MTLLANLFYKFDSIWIQLSVLGTIRSIKDLNPK